MKINKNNRKVWTKPVIQTLKISKHTFSSPGANGAEWAGKSGPPPKS
jgi:hypothetical protein